MSITPLMTFKAGACDFDTSSSPPKVLPKPASGYIYLYEEDDLIQFCWRPRAAPMSSPELKLSMVPTDGQFIPYQEKSSDSSTIKSPTNGRIFVLKFQSSSSRHLFWLQSRSQHPQGDPSWFSPRDLKWGEIVNRLLQGEEVDIAEEVADTSNENQGGGGDTEMEDARPEGGEIQGNIGSGDPFMGNPENEGSGSRDGGADGGRAPNIPTDAAAAVQNFLQSLRGSNAPSQSQPPEGALYTTLPELLPSSTTIPIIDTAPTSLLNSLLSHLPPSILTLNQEPASSDDSYTDPTPAAAQAAIDALSVEQKRDILRRVMRSPQFSQSLGSLTQAIRDGGLPTISDALGVPVKNGGYVKAGSGVPQGGGDAVEAFVEGIRAKVEGEAGEEKEEGEGEGEGKMDVE